MNDNAQDLYMWIDPNDIDQVSIGYKVNEAKVAKNNMITIASTDLDGLAGSVGVSYGALDRLSSTPCRIKLGIEFIEEN